MNTNFKQRLASLALSLSLLVSLSVPALAEETKQQPTPPQESAAAAAEYALLYGQGDSVQYALWDNGKITLSGHVGSYSRTENRAMLDTDLYGIGSVSKVYTTAAVMKLVQEGKISLDAPVTRYLPTFKMADDRYKAITVRMLLNHSSGLMGSSTSDAFLFDDADRTATEELLTRLSTQRLKAAPGAYSVYCNDGFTLAELVVEAVSGLSFPEYVHKALLAPNGLGNTFAPGDEFDASRLARTYLGQDNRPLATDSLGIVGTGGLYASASDLASFGGLLTGDKLLSASSRKAMASAEYAKGLWPDGSAGSITYGLGWDCVEWFPFSQNGIQALVKGGDTLQYHAGLVVLPEQKLAAAVVSSGGVSVFNQMAATRILIDALAEKGVKVDETTPTLPTAAPAAMPKELLAKAGYYNSTAAQFKLELTEKGELTLRSLNVPDAQPQVFNYYSDGSFRDAANSALLKLVTEKNGQTYLYQHAYSPLPGLGVLPASDFVAVQVAENPVTPEVQFSWDKSVAACLFLLDEKYSSQTWLQALTGAFTEGGESIPGYAGAARIADGTKALYELQIPGAAGRDGNDFTLLEKDGLRYIEVAGIVFGDRAMLRPLSSHSGVSASIQDNGYARWYVIGDNAAGLTMTVAHDETSGFTVYDAEGAPVSSSSAWKDTSATLPAGGYVAFAGDPGDRFTLTYSKAS